jgi:hypothetical protein
VNSSSSTNLFLSAHDKIRYKRDVNRKHDRKSVKLDLGGKGWELVLLAYYHLEVYDAFLQDILKDQRFLNQTQLG